MKCALPGVSVQTWDVAMTCALRARSILLLKQIVSPKYASLSLSLLSFDLFLRLTRFQRFNILLRL